MKARLRVRKTNDVCFLSYSDMSVEGALWGGKGGMREGVEGKERQLQNARVCTGDRKMGGWLLPGATVRTRKRGEERRGEYKVWFLKRLMWPEISLGIVSSS